MTSKKQNSTIAIVVSSLLMTMSCNDNSILPASVKLTTAAQAKVNTNARVANYTFDGTEGDPIPLDVASRWIANYTTANLGALSAHFFGNKTLEKLLAKNGCMGLRFYYSIDESNKSNLLVMGADGRGQDFSSDFRTRGKNSSVVLNIEASSNAIFSGAESDSIVLDTSKQWLAHYNSNNPAGIQAHFFGHQIIKQILSQNGCVGIRCYCALNDAGVQQLLLIGVTSSGQNILPQSLNGGRTTGDGTIADMSLPCPTYCQGS